MHELTPASFDARVEVCDGTFVLGFPVKYDAGFAHLANHGLWIVFGRTIVDHFNLYLLRPRSLAEHAYKGSPKVFLARIVGADEDGDVQGGR